MAVLSAIIIIFEIRKAHLEEKRKGKYEDETM